MTRRYIISCFNRKTKRGAGLLSLFARSNKEAMAMAENILRGSKDMPHDAELFTTFERRVRIQAVNEFIHRAWNPAMKP